MAVGVTATGLGWTTAASAQDAAEAGATRGAEIYGELCASCHGRYGRGDGPLAGNLAAAPPDFVDSAWLASRSDDQIAKGLRGASHGPMAVALVLDEPSLRDALAYIRRLSVPGKGVSLLQGRDIYNASCYACHGVNGDGKGPATTANFPDPQPRDFTSPDFVIEGREDEVARIVTLGAKAAFHGSPYMVDWGSRLSPQQIRDVVEYLKTFRKR
jgi:mono/diheme cytochrome c family protein